MVGEYANIAGGGLLLILATIGALLCIQGCSGDILIRTSPEIIWTYPADGATNVSTADTIKVGFSRTMDASSVTIETFFIDNDVEGEILYTGTTALFVPWKSLEFKTTYTVTVTTGIRDREGISLRSGRSWSFTTKPPPPHITGFSPDSGRVGAEVTIVGSSFYPSVTGNAVRFNLFPRGGSAPIIKATADTIIARVPYGAATGYISVRTAGGVAFSATQFTVIQPGNVWEVVAAPTFYTLEDVAWLETQYIAVGAVGTILKSPDGKQWTVEESGTTNRLYGVARSTVQIVAVGAGGVILTSGDGRRWGTGNSGTTVDLFAVTWADVRFVAVGADGLILTSPDGVSWAERQSGTVNSLYDVTALGNLMVTCGLQGIILVSTDPALWFEHTSGTSDPLLGVTSASDQLIAVGYNGTVLTSADGEAWTRREAGTTQHLGGVTLGVTPAGGLIAVAGSAGTILTSVDGITWTEMPSPTEADLYDVAWSGRNFIAVGADGLIVISE